MYPEVMFHYAHRHYSSCKATLYNYARRQVKNQYYPGVIPNQGSKVEGVLYSKVQPDDLARLDAFENDAEAPEYFPQLLKVQAEKGELIQALVYVHMRKEELCQEDWNVEYFLKNEHKDYPAYNKAKDEKEEAKGTK